jgi:hypothetical protein
VLGSTLAPSADVAEAHVRRPFQATCGPWIARPLTDKIFPDKRSCTYLRSAGLVASLAHFGRRAARSACHCAVVARYSIPPLRVAALRRSSREIVEADRHSVRAIWRIPWPLARSRAIRSRSAKDRYRPESGGADCFKCDGGIPPASRNHRTPTGHDTLALSAASTVESPE